MISNDFFTGLLWRQPRGYVNISNRTVAYGRFVNIGTLLLEQYCSSPRRNWWSANLSFLRLQSSLDFHNAYLEKTPGIFLALCFVLTDGVQITQREERKRERGAVEFWINERHDTARLLDLGR